MEVNLQTDAGHREEDRGGKHQSRLDHKYDQIVRDFVDTPTCFLYKLINYQHRAAGKHKAS